MASNKEKRDKHFPLFAHDNPFRRLFMPPRRFVESFVAKDQTVADLGCGPGFYTIALAECAGPGGKVYAVDSDEKAIRAVEKKAGERDSAVSEIKRILKPGGRAYISVARGPWSYVSRAEWGKILEGFRVERKGSQGFVIADRWAVVSLKNG
jgi:SAM-dependent methyltransferase